MSDKDSHVAGHLTAAPRLAVFDTNMECNRDHDGWRRRQRHRRRAECCTNIRF